MKFIFKLILLVIMISCFGCVTYLGYDGPYEGQFIDMDTRQPIEGVVVQGGWSRVHFPMGGHSDVDFKEVLTNKNGNFKINGVGILVFSNIEEMDFCALKAGYSQVGYCFGPWSSLKQYEEVEWNNGKPIIKLKRLTFEERRNRHLDFRGPGTLSKNKLSWLEYNKEMIETCQNKGENRLFPTGNEKIPVSTETESLCNEPSNKEYNVNRTLIPISGMPPRATPQLRYTSPEGSTLDTRLE